MAQSPGGAGRRSRRELGRIGEELAVAELARAGLRIVARNVHLRAGEIDLVALEGATLCLVEVRLRSSARWGSPEESLDARKRRRLRRAAALLLAGRDLPPLADLPPFARVRFDLVAVDASSHPPRVRHLRGVIED